MTLEEKILKEFKKSVAKNSFKPIILVMDDIDEDVARMYVVSNNKTALWFVGTLGVDGMQDYLAEMLRKSNRAVVTSTSVLDILELSDEA